MCTKPVISNRFFIHAPILARLPRLRLLRHYPAFILTLLLTSFSSRAQAAGVFSGAQSAMDCIVKASATGGVTNALISKLPSTIFSLITVLIFAYMLIGAIQIFQAIRNGEEATQFIIPIVSTFAGLVIIMFMQAMLFGNSTC
jgi:hypothetical protein